MKLLHTGDLHLDSPFCALGNRDAEARREQQRKTLCRIFECAHEEGCDLILLAGDLFDSRFVTPETDGLVRRLLRETSCQVVISRGNHDPYTATSFWSRGELPEHVQVFSRSELQSFFLDQLNTRVWGYAFDSAGMRQAPLTGSDGAKEAIKKVISFTYPTKKQRKPP